MSKKEGDTNNNSYYLEYINNHSLNTKESIYNDATVFLHQALSSPVLGVLKSAKNSKLITNDYQEILDFHGNNVHQLGYMNPYIIDAMKKQLDILPFVPRRYTSEISIEAANKLVELTEGKLSRVLFTTSGSASISTALKIARMVTKKNKVATTYDSFHGANLDTINIGAQLEFKQDLGYFESNIHFLPYNPYNCPLGKCSNCDYLCLTYLDYQLDQENDYGAILLEPIRSTKLYIPDKEYFKRLRKICDKHKILLIFDEIPLSFGKTGKYFVYQNFDIVPDILVLGKGLGAGLIPFSCIICKEEYNIGQELSIGHYTHEKSPLASSVLLAQIKYIDQNNILSKVAELNNIISKELTEIQDSFKSITHTRSIGNMFAIELDRNISVSDGLVYEFLKEGINLKISEGYILLFMPPLIIEEKEIIKAFQIIKKILKKIEV